MRLFGQVGAVSVKKFPRFEVDQKTGEVWPDPTYILQATVTDLDNPQSLYQCSFDTGFGLEGLKEARKAKASEADRDVIAAQVEAQAKQLEGQRVELVIKKSRAKNSFLTLMVASVQLLPQAAVA